MIISFVFSLVFDSIVLRFILKYAIIIIMLTTFWRYRVHKQLRFGAINQNSLSSDCSTDAQNNQPLHVHYTYTVETPHKGTIFHLHNSTNFLEEFTVVGSQFSFPLGVQLAQPELLFFWNYRILYVEDFRL